MSDPSCKQFCEQFGYINNEAYGPKIRIHCRMYVLDTRPLNNEFNPIENLPYFEKWMKHYIPFDFISGYKDLIHPILN